MMRRLTVGMIKGLLIGGIAAFLLVQVLGLTTFGAFFAYAAAALMGVLTGLFAGKPFWTPEAKIEVALKCVIGAGIAAATMFAVRKWVPLELDLSWIGAGAGEIGALPAVSLPLIATFLAIVFELDNTDDVPATDARAQIAPPRQRLAEQEDGDVEEELELNEPSRKARKH
jgi:hypothetical protein